VTRAGWMIAAVTITAITVIARHISVGDAGLLQEATDAT
jgi:hypothetical protein